MDRAVDDADVLAAATLRWFSDLSVQGFFTTDASLVVRGWNRFMAELTGLTRADVIGRGLFDVFPELRELSARATVDLGFEAYAIGGLSVGEPPSVMHDLVSRTAPLLPEDRPRYLMGTGTPEDLVESVARGIDLFDCVLPTRNARNGQLFTSEGRLNIKNARYAEDDRPPDPACGCYTCRTASRAYLRHLFLAGEITASTLNTLHNLNFYLDTVRGIRESVKFGRFESFRVALHQRLSRQPADSE